MLLKLQTMHPQSQFWQIQVNQMHNIWQGLREVRPENRLPRWRVQAGAHISEEPGLAPFGVQVGMPPEEGVEGGQLVPARLQLCIHITKEPPDVRPWHNAHCSDYAPLTNADCARCLLSP